MYKWANWLILFIVVVCSIGFIVASFIPGTACEWGRECINRNPALAVPGIMFLTMIGTVVWFGRKKNE